MYVYKCNCQILLYICLYVSMYMKSSLSHFDFVNVCPDFEYYKYKIGSNYND